MNRLVIIVFILTVVALAWLGLISFGPLAKSRTQAHRNPGSLQPSATSTSVPFSTFHNSDLKENFYTIQFPKDWSVQAGQMPGSYALSFPGGNGTAQLMDVPDNSTLELFVLSQEVPRFKQQLTAYRQISYDKTTLDGHEAHRLTYQSIVSGQTQQTVRTYVAGADRATVITLTSAAGDSALTPLFASVEQSFHWEMK